MNLNQVLLIGYILCLMVTFSSVFALVTAVRFGSKVLGPKRTVVWKGPLGGAVGLTRSMERLCGSVVKWRPRKALTDGTRLIVVKSHMAAAQVLAKERGGALVLETGPRPLVFIRFCMWMILASFVIGPVAPALMAAAVSENRKLGRGLHEETLRMICSRERKLKEMERRSKSEGGKGTRGGSRKKKREVTHEQRTEGEGSEKRKAKGDEGRPGHD